MLRPKSLAQPQPALGPFFGLLSFGCFRAVWRLRVCGGFHAWPGFEDELAAVVAVHREVEEDLPGARHQDRGADHPPAFVLEARNIV